MVLCAYVCQDLISRYSHIIIVNKKHLSTKTNVIDTAFCKSLLKKNRDIYDRESMVERSSSTEYIFMGLSVQSSENLILIIPLKDQQLAITLLRL